MDHTFVSTTLHKCAGSFPVETPGSTMTPAFILPANLLQSMFPFMKINRVWIVIVLQS